MGKQKSEPKAAKVPIAREPTPVRPDQDNPQLEEAVNRPPKRQTRLTNQ